jgi:uncharacterized protein
MVTQIKGRNNMTINDNNWTRIKKFYYDAYKTSLHCAIATVDENGFPNISPIGSLILTEKSKGFYFDEFTKNMADNLKKNQQVCAIIVKTSKLFWLKSLFVGKFSSPPAIRLYGTVGEKRKATSQEIQTFLNYVKPFKYLKGYKLLWSNMKIVRDIHFNSFRIVQTGKITRRLWQEKSFLKFASDYRLPSWNHNS